MPSRRPPSQRDPAYALHRLPGTVAQAAPGLKVKNAAPVKAATPNRTAAPAGGDSNHPGTGLRSIALGTSAAASAADTTAVGSSAQATAAGATAYGLGATATGQYGVALGASTVADVNGVAIGLNSKSGPYNVAIGVGAGPNSVDAAYTGGGACVAIGQGARTRETTGIAIGLSTNISSVEGIAIGRSANIGFSADQSIAIGRDASGTGLRSIALGYGANANADECRVKVDTLHVQPSSGGPQSFLILWDDAGTPRTISVDSTTSTLVVT